MKKKKILVVISICIIVISLIVGVFYYVNIQNNKVESNVSIKDDKKSKETKEENKDKFIEATYNDEEQIVEGNDSQNNINTQSTSNNNSQTQTVQQNSNSGNNNDINTNTQNEQQQSVNTQTQSSSNTQTQPSSEPSQNYKVRYYTENGIVKSFSYDECKAFSVEYAFTDTVNIVGTSCVPISSDLYKMEIRYLN